MDGLKMKKKTKIILTVVVVMILVVSAVLFFVVLQGTKKDPLSNLKYANRGLGFGLNPPDGWNISESASIPVTFTCPEKYNSLDLSFSIRVLGSDVPLNKLVEDYLSNINQNPSFYPNLTSHEERTVNGMNAHEFVFIVNITGYPESKEKIIFVEGKKIMSIELIGPMYLYDKYESVAEQSINSFTIV
jgi:hypothetical protein